MVTVILMIITIILFFGMVGDNEKFNKRTYCFGFVACVVAIAAMEIAGRIF
jgi:hypothetical protein